ncbi:hypothetical protein BH09PAT1_BH09PAT1_0420 [soil metagenome]
MASPDIDLGLGFGKPSNSTPDIFSTSNISPYSQIEFPPHGYPIAGTEHKESYTHLSPLPPLSQELSPGIVVEVKPTREL